MTFDQKLHQCQQLSAARGMPFHDALLVKANNGRHYIEFVTIDHRPVTCSPPAESFEQALDLQIAALTPHCEPTELTAQIVNYRFAEPSIGRDTAQIMIECDVDREQAQVIKNAHLQHLSVKITFGEQHRG